MALTNTGYCDTGYHDMCPVGQSTTTELRCMCSCHSFPEETIVLTTTNKPKGKTNVKL